MPDIQSCRILILATHGFEQSELLVPRDKLLAAGASVDVVSPERGAIRGWKHKEWGESVKVDRQLADVSVDEYEVLVLPGGQINPDLLRVNAHAVQLIRDFFSAGKIIAAICHAPWLLIEAGVISGREVTSYRSIRTDVINAGGLWRDETVVVDNGLITSRHPGDLDAFVDRIIEEAQEGAHMPRTVRESRPGLGHEMI